MHVCVSRSVCQCNGYSSSVHAILCSGGFAARKECMFVNEQILLESVHVFKVTKINAAYSGRAQASITQQKSIIIFWLH